MAKTELIVNGSFESSAARIGNTAGPGWTGNDIEVNREFIYLQNGQTDKLVEMDGYPNQTTILEQEFTVTNGYGFTELTFNAALRNSVTTAEGDGFSVEIIDSNGTSVSSMNVLPQTHTMSQYTLPVNLVNGETYTVRFTELGNNSGQGAVLDDISLLICFSGETNIETETGEKLASQVRPGDLLSTKDGFKEVSWVGRRKISAEDMKLEPLLRPVKIHAGALGKNLPRRDLWVSRQHRMLVDSPLALLLFGENKVLIPAHRLTALDDIEIDETIEEIEYVHFLFADHQILFAEGAPTESLLLGKEAQKTLNQDTLDEIELIFGFDIRDEDVQTPAETIVRGRKQTDLVTRLGNKNRMVLENYVSY